MPRASKADIASTASKITLEASDHFKECVAEAFLDESTNDQLKCSDLMAALKPCGLSFVNWQMNDLFVEYGTDKNASLDLSGFAKIAIGEENKKTNKITMSASKKVDISNKGTTHVRETGLEYIKKGEIRQFSNYLNRLFVREKDDQITKKLKLTIDPGSPEDLFDKIGNGVIFCHLINLIEPGTIPTKAINYTGLNSIFKKIENLKLSINSAASIGCTIISCTPHIIMEKHKNVCLGLLWQLIARHSLQKIALNRTSGLVNLLAPGETIQDLMNLTAEELLIRWVNYHLDKNDYYDGKKCGNYGADLQDGSMYIALLNELQPKEMMPRFNHSLMKSDDQQRTAGVIEMAKQLDLDDYITQDDILECDKHVNIIFLSQLFNTYPNLEEGEEFIDPDSPEEKTYKNWINSLGLKDHWSDKPLKKMMYFYPPLTTGVNFLGIMDEIQPGAVDYKKVNSPESLKKLGGFMKQLNNCDYVIEVAKSIPGMSVVGIGGTNIRDSHPMYVQAIVWQLMRLYTLSLVKDCFPEPIKDSEADDKICQWANQKLADAGKAEHQFKHFADKSLADSMAIFHLVNAISPGSVKFEYIGENAEENAVYALATCRMIGAQIYALPHHVTLVEKKMIMTVFACLMVAEKQNEKEKAEMDK